MDGGSIICNVARSWWQTYVLYPVRDCCNCFIYDMCVRVGAAMRTDLGSSITKREFIVLKKVPSMHAFARSIHSPCANVQLFAEIDVNDNGKLSMKEYSDNISRLAPQFSGQHKAIFDCLSTCTV